VREFGPVALARQSLADLLGQRDRAVTPTGASNRHGQVTLPLANVMREEIKEQVHEPRDEFLRLREARHEAANGSVPAGLALELRNVVGIGEKAHVENQVCVWRNAEPKPEGDDGEQDRFSSGHSA